MQNVTISKHRNKLQNFVGQHEQLETAVRNVVAESMHGNSKECITFKINLLFFIFVFFESA